VQLANPITKSIASRQRNKKFVFMRLQFYFERMKK